MERWGVPDATALELIGYPGKLGPSGKRPRFRLSTRQVQMLGYLEEIDRAAHVAHGDPGAWLGQRQRAAPMSGRSPLQAMAQGGAEAMAAILQTLTRSVMQRAVRRAASTSRRNEE